MSLLTLVFKPLAYVSLPIFLLRSIASSSPTSRYYIRIFLYYSTLGICSVWGMVVAVWMSLLGRRFDINWLVARSFYFMGSRMLDIKFIVEGEEYLETRPAVLVGNHQSGLDVLYLGRIFPKHASIMAKQELKWTPLLGGFMSLSGAIFVNRGNNAQAVRSLQAAGDFMKKNTTSLWMFPEGTRSMREHHDMLPFKKGAFHVAVEAGLPVIPVVCENYWRMYRKGVFESGELKLRVLPPIPTTGLTNKDVTELAVQIRERMVAALREISVPEPSPDTPADSVTVAERIPSAVPNNSSSQISVDARTEIEWEPSEGSVASSRKDSENGVDTEDEGMVFVDRP